MGNILPRCDQSAHFFVGPGIYAAKVPLMPKSSLWKDVCLWHVNPIYPRGAIWPPLVKIAPVQKIGPGRRPGLLGELIWFSYGCFLKILRDFHDPVKNYVGFVEAGWKNPIVIPRNRDKTRSDPSFSRCAWHIHWTLSGTFLVSMWCLDLPQIPHQVLAPTFKFKVLFGWGAIWPPPRVNRFSQSPG